MCDTGYSGTNCDVDISVTGPLSVGGLTGAGPIAGVVIAGVVLLVILLLLVLFGLLVYTRKKSPERTLFGHSLSPTSTKVDSEHFDSRYSNVELKGGNSFLSTSPSNEKEFSNPLYGEQKGASEEDAEYSSCSPGIQHDFKNPLYSDSTSDQYGHGQWYNYSTHN